MNNSKLAQFQKISNSSDDLGCEFLKRCTDNLNYIISSDTSEEVNRQEGYSYLHIAVKNFDLLSTHELIKRKVDLVKQAHKDGQTPLHIASVCFRNEKSSPFDSDKSVMSYVGKLKENKFVEALLFAQVESGITTNPKSADGTSHLQIACMYNDIRAVQLFLSAGESVDHPTNDKHRWPGHTALHFAIRYSAFEAAEILLHHGADIHLKDLGGKSPLHLIIERLMDIADFLALGKRSYCPFYEQERDMLESILQVFLKSPRVEDVLDDSGLSLLHVLCILKDSILIKQFFKQNMDVNCATKSDSKLWPGWTPLHFAACFNVETFKFLLQHGADLTVKNAKGNTPLDFCMERYTPNIIHSILSTKQEFKNILFSDGSTKLLDIILIMTNFDMFIKWFESLANVDISVPLDSLIWPGCNLLHLAVWNERKHFKDAKMMFEADLSRCTFESYLSKYMDVEPVDDWKRIMNCLLTKSYNFLEKNADGLSPFFLAFQLHKTTSAEMILNSRKNNDELNGLSCFHIACATGNMEVIKRFADRAILNKPVDSDFDWYSKNYSSELTLVHVPAKSTPLHIAVIFKRSEVIEYLIENGAKMHSKDQRGLDPFHLALSKDIAQAFFKRMLKSGRLATHDNLPYLHIAALRDDAKAIKKLLEMGANIETCFEPTNPEVRSTFAKDIGKTPLHIAISHRKSQATEALIKAGADILASCSSGKNPEKLLHRAILAGEHTSEDFLAKLKQKKRYAIRPIDETTGMTMLHIACEKRDLKWAKSLLKKRADPNCRLDLEARLCISVRGSTSLGLLANSMRHWVEVKDQAAASELAETLIEYGADATIKNRQGRTPLHVLYYGAHDTFTYSCGRKYSDYMLSAIPLLLKAYKTYDVNPTDPRGLSHFHLACFTSNLEAAKGFLDAGVDVNQTYDPFAEVELHAGYTPLHFALNQKNAELARLLIECGANVKAEDVRGDTPLHTSLKHGFVDVQLIGLMLRQGVDVNAKNAKGTTPMEYLFETKAFTLQQFHIMSNHGAVIDLTSVKPPGAGILGLALKNAEPNDRQFIFDRIINACDVKSIVKKGINVIDSAVNVEQEDQLTVDDYLNVIDQLIDAGCDINQEDQQGKTTLHRATSLYNTEAVKALLLAGADLNVVDKNGESPLTKEVFKDERHNQRERKRETLFFLVSQIWKMQNIGLEANEITKTAFLELFQRYTSFEDRNNFDDIRELCLVELNNKVRKTFIKQLSLESFLSDTEAVMWYSRMPLAERQLIDAFFKCGDNVRRGFPEWGGFLMMQYRKAVARAKMIRPAMRVIFSAGIKLPALCLEEIVEYLNYDEMKLLVREL